MATALLTINADAGNALNVIQQLQDALNDLQNNANLQLGMNANNNQLQRINRGITELTSLTNAWAAAITRNVGNALRDAFHEIQNIDDELVTIRRVTGRTGAELDALTAKATNVAKTYGTSASDYLKSVSSFSKAGYGEAADALGELSVKAQRVGDLTQAVSDQFLLAVDKGYQFNGSIEQLSAVLDGANEIGNKFATDIDQIAAGLGKVAPIAAQAHVSIYELEAALGTISAVTQRSGTEAATALRALFLNIMGDTKTEIEDGATWTAGEIEGLRDLLNIYAADVVKAAEETGKVINPMEAIAALSKAFREGVLTEQALVSMVSDIGGKLRTTQLLALIQNWEMYTAMVETAENATGSADKEIENSLDSITVKINQLRASWVDMVSDTINSRFIKNTIDFATKLLTSFGDLQGVLAAVAGIVLTLRGYRLGETFRNIFTGIHNGGLGGFISMIGVAQVALSTFLTVVNMIKQNTVEEINRLVKTASEAEKTSDSIYDLYMKVKQATPGTDEYTAALARLAAQMKLTGDEAQNLATNIDSVTLAELNKQKSLASAAYQDIGTKLSDVNWFNNPFALTWSTIGAATAREYEFNIEKQRKEIQDAVKNNLRVLFRGKNNYSLFKENSGVGGSNLFQTLQFTDADELILAYEQLEKTKEALIDIAKTDASVYKNEIYLDIGAMMSALKDQYTQAKSALDSVVSTATNVKSAELAMNSFGTTWKELNDQIVGGGEVDAGKREAAIEQMKSFVDSIWKDTTLSPMAAELVEKNIIYQLSEQFPELIKYINEWQDIIAHKPAQNGVAETADEATASVKNLVDAINQATKAKNEFDKAMAEDKENADFQNYKEAYDTYTKELEEGRVNSKLLKAAAKYLLGEEAYNAAYANGGYKGVNAAMKSSNLDLLYGEESGDYAEGFFKYLTKYANQAGEIVDANGRIVASMTNVGEAIQFQIDDYQALSEKTGLPLHQLAAAVRALGVYGEIVSPEIDALKEQLVGLGQEIASYDEKGRLSVNYDALLKSMTPEQLASDNWKAFKEYLNLANELGEIDLKNVTEGWLEADDAAKKATESAKEAKEAQTGAGAAQQTEAVGTAAGNAADKISALNVILETISQNQGPEAAAQALEMIMGAAKAAGAEIEAVDGKITSLTMKDGGEITWEWMTNLIANCGTVQAGLDGVLQKIIEINGNPVNLEFKFDSEGAIAEIVSVQDSIGDTPEKVTTYFFGADGNIEKCVSVVEELVNGEKITRTTTKFFGEDGNITTVVEVVEGLVNGEKVTKTTTMFYGEDGGVVKKVEEVENELTGVKTSTTMFYGEDGGVVKKVEEVEDKIAGVKESTTYFYGENGNIIETTQAVESLVTGETITSHTTYFYGNDDELQRTVTTVKTDDGKTIATYITYFKKDGDKDVVKAIEYFDNKNGKDSKYTIVFGEKDENGRTIAQVTTDVQTLNGIKTITVEIETTGDGAEELALAVENAQKLVELRRHRLDTETKERAEKNGGIDPETGNLVAPPTPAPIPSIDEVMNSAENAAEAAENSEEAAEDAAEAAAETANALEEIASEVTPPPPAPSTTPPPTASATTPPPTASATTPPPTASATTPPPTASATTPPPTASATTPPPTASATAPPKDSIVWTAFGALPTLLDSLAQYYSDRFNSDRERSQDKNAIDWLTSTGPGDVADAIGMGAFNLLSSLFGNNGAASEWLRNATTASEPSWISGEEKQYAEHAPDDVAEQTGKSIAEGISTWWQNATTASEPSWIANVELNATGNAKEIADVIESDGKTVKVGVNTVEKGSTEEVVEAFTSGDDDNKTITKELAIEASDNTLDLLDGVYELDGQEDANVKLNVSTNENGIQTLQMVEKYGEDGLTVETYFTVDGDGLVQIKEIQKIGEEISGEKQMTVTADTASANNSIQRLLDRLRQLQNKTVTVTANVKGGTGVTSAVSNAGVGGGSIFDRVSQWLATGKEANAKGTKHFGGGLSLINEEGPELVTADGWARILANGEPTIANIPKGATIYTAKETAQILNGSKQNTFPAFAGGIGDWLADWASKTPVGQAIKSVVDPVVNGAKKLIDSVIAGSKGTVTIPEKKEEKKDDTKKTTTGGGGSAKKDEAEFWDVIQKYIEYGLKKIQYQIDERQEAITALERERDRLMKPIDKEMDELNWQIREAEYRIKMIERSRDDATKALKDQIDALKEAREIEEDEEQLEEKRLAVIEAENALKDAQYDRTVRYYNESTGQWEWMADQSAVKNAEDALKDAQEAYEDALADYQITQLERQVKAIEKMYDEQAKPYQEEVDAYNRQVEDLQYQRDKIEREYATSIDPLQEAMDEIQQTYDDLEKYYSKVQDAIAVPMEDLDAALTAMQGAEANYANQFENVQSLLDTLYDLAPTWDAISAGTLGVSAAAGAISNTNFADILNNNGQTIIINGLSVEGDGSMSLNELIAKAGIYRNYNE